VFFSAKPCHALRAGAFFAVKWSFFGVGARAGRMTALACKIFCGGVMYEHDHTDSVGGEKTE